MKKRVSLFIVSCCLCLTGCFDKAEVEEKAYVIALGLDKAKDEHKIKVSFQIANPEVGSIQAAGGTDEPPHEIITVTVNDFISARSVLNTVIAKEITYDLLRVIIISEELAKEENFIRYIYEAAKDREIRRDVLLAVSKEEASKYLEENDPKQETRPHKYYQFMINQGIDTGLIPESDLHRFFRITEHDADLFLAMYTTTERSENEVKDNQDEYLAGQIDTKGSTNKTQFIGSAVFKEGKMIGKLNGRDTRIAVLLDGTTDLKDVLTTYEDPLTKGYRLAVRLIKNKPVDVQVNIKNSPAKIKIHVPLVAEVLSDPGMTNYARNEDKQEKLRQHIEQEIDSNISEFIKKTQEELGGSPFSLSLYGRKHFLTIPEFVQFDWMKSYPDMDIDVSVDIEFGEFGKQAKVPYLEELRD
ncbi:Ger(x)C family spore germination protein [Cytobacillus suaedae]|nr:Ger(x)C family spore germination protein [Cytobacillus suaedae]